MLKKRIFPIAAALLTSQMAHSALVNDVDWRDTGSQTSLVLVLFNETGAFVVDTGLLAGEESERGGSWSQAEIELDTIAGYADFGVASSFTFFGAFDFQRGDIAFSYSELLYIDPTVGLVYASGESQFNRRSARTDAERAHFENLRSMITAEGFSAQANVDAFQGYYGGVKRFGDITNPLGRRISVFDTEDHRYSYVVLSDPIAGESWSVKFENDVFYIENRTIPLPAASWFFISGIAGLTVLKKKNNHG